MFCFSIVMYFPGVQIIYIIITVSVFNKNAHIYIHVQADLIAIHKFVKAKIPQNKS